MSRPFGFRHTRITKQRMSIANSNSRNGMWKGEKAGCITIHQWVRKKLPKPSLCQICGESPPYDLASISHDYKRNLNDWTWLCRKCHMVTDGRLKRLHDSKRKPRRRLKCQACNNNFFVIPSRGNARFCSRKCKSIAFKDKKYWGHLFNE